MPAVPAVRAAGLVVGVGGVPAAGGDDCGHGVLLIVSARLPERSKALPCSAECAKDRPVRAGSSGGHPSEEAKPAGRAEAGEATAEPAATVAAPRSARLRPIGAGPPFPRQRRRPSG